jgi:hypothetical protein
MKLNLSHPVQRYNFIHRVESLFGNVNISYVQTSTTACILCTLKMSHKNTIEKVM